MRPEQKAESLENTISQVDFKLRLVSDAANVLLSQLCCFLLQPICRCNRPILPPMVQQLSQLPCYCFCCCLRCLLLMLTVVKSLSNFFFLVLLFFLMSLLLWKGEAFFVAGFLLCLVLWAFFFFLLFFFFFKFFFFFFFLIALLLSLHLVLYVGLYCCL